MKRLSAVLPGLLVLATLLPLAAGAAEFAMDCDKPLYVPVALPDWIKPVFLDKGAKALIPVSVTEIDSLPGGAVILYKLTTNVTSTAKYFGPANWVDYTCDVSRVVLAQKMDGRMAEIYVGRGQATRAKLSPNEDVEELSMDACRSAIRKALSGVSCESRPNWSSQPKAEPHRHRPFESGNDAIGG